MEHFTGGTVPIVDGRAVFDPTVNNFQGFVEDPDTGELLLKAAGVGLQQLFVPDLLEIPPASSKKMIELNFEIQDRGDESTPNDTVFPDATHEDVQHAQFRLASSPAELYVPGFCDPFSRAPSETYWTGFYQGPGGNNRTEDSGVPLPGFEESHQLRSRIRSLPTGHGFEAITDVSTDGGATYQRIGRTVDEYAMVAGADAENPGFFNRFLFHADSGPPACDNCLEEGEFSMDFVKLEIVDLAPPDTGDMDLDGDTDFDDINDFVLGLNNEAEYRSTFWVEASQNGDTDGDNDLDFDDITGFVGILSGGGGVAQGVPEPTSLVLALLGALCALVNRLQFSPWGNDGGTLP